MPTGYTADVADGQVTDFRTFALRCARAFGATIMQRDDPMDQPPALRQVGEFYGRNVETARARVAEVATLTMADAERESAAEYDRALAQYAESMQSRATERNRYNAMLVLAMGWQPPTPDHAEMKTFMIDQLTEGRRFDCDYTPSHPVRVDAATWLAREVASADANLDRAMASLGEEMQRCAKANAWIVALYESLEVSNAPR